MGNIEGTLVAKVMKELELRGADLDNFGQQTAVEIEESIYPNDMPDYEAHTTAGNAIAQLFSLKKDREHKDRYITSWGSKTAYGLTQVVLRLAEDIKAGKEIS